MLSLFSEQVHSLTSDIGEELAHHKIITKILDAKYCIAYHYVLWERGQNDNTNNLFRQYYPMKLDCQTITQNKINRAMGKLNNRHMKCLGIKAPNNKIFLGINHSVVLVS